MPTLLKINGFRFFFYSNEHEPMHIHILKNENFAKVSLENLKVEFSNFKNSDLDFVLKIIKEHKDEFIKAWQEYFKGE